MNKIIEGIAIVFFVIGAIDYFLDNKFGIGEKFFNGINSMGSLAMGIIGIYSLTNYISDFMIKVFTPISKVTKIDVSVFSSLFLAIDIGGYKVATTVASSEDIGKFSGVLIASGIGTLICFSLPVALNIVKGDDIEILMQGFIISFISMPFGVFFGGLAQGIKINMLLLNCLPVIIISALIFIMYAKRPKYVKKFFNVFQKVIKSVGLFGLICQALYSIKGILVLEKIIPLQESFFLVGKISIFLGGIFSFIHFIQRVFSRQIYLLSKKLNMNQISLVSLLGNFVSCIVVFEMFKDMDRRGKLVSAVLSATLASIIGAQLAYVTSTVPTMLTPFLISKIIPSIVGVLIIIFMEKNITT